MKNTKNLLILLTLIFVLTNSCNKTEPSNRKLKGTWELSTIDEEPLGEKENVTITFSSGGQFESLGGDSSAFSGNRAGSWSIWNDKSKVELEYNENFITYFEEIELTKELFKTTPFGVVEEWVFEKKE
jgi:hypothetical protein